MTPVFVVLSSCFDVPNAVNQSLVVIFSRTHTDQYRTLRSIIILLDTTESGNFKSNLLAHEESIPIKREQDHSNDGVDVLDVNDVKCVCALVPTSPKCSV